MIPWILQFLGMGGMGGAAAKAAMPTSSPTAAAMGGAPGAAGDIALRGGIRTAPTATPGNAPGRFTAPGPFEKVMTALDAGAGSNPQAAALGTSAGQAPAAGAMPVHPYRGPTGRRPVAGGGGGGDQGMLQQLLQMIMQNRRS